MNIRLEQTKDYREVENLTREAFWNVDVTSVVFWLIYGFCGISDIADGWLARKLKCVTKTGALLDSVADICFVACCAWKLLPMWPPSPRLPPFTRGISYELFMPFVTNRCRISQMFGCLANNSYFCSVKT